jgi:hypothetical protein
MDILTSLLRMTMVILLIRALFAIGAGIMMTRKMKKVQESAELEAVNRQLLEQRLRQQSQAQEAQKVKDDYCGKLIDKSKAYIIRHGDKYHHFCSWDCRQKYIENTSA